MSQRLINIGTGPNTKDGDTVRQAFNLTNENFTELYTLLGQNSNDFTGNLSGSLFTDNSTLVVDGLTGNVYTDNLVLGGSTLEIDGLGNLTINGTPLGGNGVAYDQSLNTTDSVGFSSVAAAYGFIAQINGTNPGQELVIQSGGSHNFTFHNSGLLEIPNAITAVNTTVQIVQADCAPGTPTVIYTAGSNITGLKMLVVLEGYVNGDGTGPHTQTCEVILAARGAAITGQPAVTVYGIVHTSPSPLATITAQRNLTTGAIEVIATETSGLPGTNLAVRSRVIDTITRLEI